MAEQITPPDEGQQSEHAVGAPDVQPSLVPPDWFPAAQSPAPSMLGPELRAGPQEQAFPWGQPWPGQAGALTGQAPATQPERSRRRKVIVIVAVTAASVLIAGGIGLGVALSRSSGQTFPATLLGLTRDTSPDAQQVAGQMTSSIGVLQGIVVHPGAAVYGSGPNAGLLVLVAHWSDAAKADGLVSATSAEAVVSLKSQGIADATSFPAGPNGGGLACGHKTSGGQTAVICELMDHKVFLVTVYFGTASNLSDAAAKTVKVRSAVES